MNRRRLKESLEDLRAEIQSAELSDGASKARLEALIRDLERQIEHPEDDEQRATLARNVKEAIEHFEAEHPGPAGILNHIMVILGNMGL